MARPVNRRAGMGKHCMSDATGVIRATIEDARLEVLARLGRSVDPPPGMPYTPRGSDMPVDAGGWEPDSIGLPPDCPVEPLGMGEGVVWFLDTIGRHVAIPSGSLNQGTIRALFAGRPNYLMWAWPKRNSNNDIISWRPERAAEDLLTACAKRGAWDPVNKLRGTGAWLGRAGELIYHAGDRIWIAGKADRIGALDGFVYSTMPRIPSPMPQIVADEDCPARWLLPLLRRWYWKRPDTDPVLMLGWIAHAAIGGALDFRPPVMLLGDFSTGKTLLQRLIKAVLGDGLVQAADATAAGIYQQVGLSSIPVALDEFEPDENNPGKQRQMLDLMRNAASGSVRMRGGAEHRGTQFNMRSALLFSAINAPPLNSAELSRIVMLQLLPLPPDAPPVELDLPRLELAGRQILRQVMDGWPLLAQRMRLYRDEMREAGHAGRGQEAYATLLALAETLVGPWAEELDVPMVDDLTPWRERLGTSTLAEHEDQLPNWYKCLAHLLSVQVEVWRNGSLVTVGQVLEDYRTARGDGGMTFTSAQEHLRKVGLALRKPRASGDLVLGVPNQNPATRKLFLGSTWAGAEGAGVWSWALRQGPPDLWEAGQVKVNMLASRGTWLHLNRLEELLPASLRLPLPGAQEGVE